MATSLPKGSFTLDGMRFDWHVRHLAGSSHPLDDARGISIEARLSGVTRKEIIVDFPFKDYGFLRPKNLMQFEDRIKRLVRAAMADGWDPESKGKPLRYPSEFLEGKKDDA